VHSRQNISVRSVLIAAVTLSTFAWGAQGSEDRPPNDPAARVAPIEYRSVFDSYQPLLENERTPWGTANADAPWAGGHAGHSMSRETSGAMPKTEQPPPPVPPQGSDRHSGH